MNEENIVVMTDETGKEVKMEYLDTVSYEDSEYAVLLPLNDEDDFFVIMKVEIDPNDEEGMIFSDVTNDDTLSAVYELFKENNSDLFTFED